MHHVTMAHEERGGGNASNIRNVGTRQEDGDLLHILPVYPQGKELVF